MLNARMDSVPDVDETADSRGLGTPLAWAVLGFILTGARMPPHATVGGVDVSGLSPQEAQERVETALGSRALVPITVLAGGRTFVVDPAKAGLTVDVEASLRGAGGFHSFNPVRMARLIGGHVEAPLVVTADDQKLNATVASIAGALDRPPVEPLITFDGTEPVVRKPKPGTVVDRDAAAAAIRAAYLVKDRIEVPVKTARPTVGQAGLDAGVRRKAAPAQ
jgi:hypothetical protein